MDPQVREFVQTAARDLIGLDVALFFQANPSVFDSASGLALRLHWKAEDLEPAIERLVACGVLEAFTRGGGRYRCYALSSEPTVWHLLCALCEAYLDEPETRKEIVRLLVREMHSDHLSKPPGPGAATS